MIWVKIETLLSVLSIFSWSIKCKYLIEEESLVYNSFHNGKEEAVYFSNKWIVKVNNKPIEEITEFAKLNGFNHVEKINDFEDYHIFEKLDHPEQYHEESFHHTNSLRGHDDIIWTEQLFGRKLYRRENVEEGRNLYTREYNDELWSLQWYETGFRLDSTTPIIDMHLVPVYREYNITGRDVNILIIDDGVEYTHDDIKDSFLPEISFNFNRNITDVMPRYADPRNVHGTRCAGVIAMKPNNEKCGVGIAYDAKIGGITLLDGVIDDLIESKAIKYKNDIVHIYSGSWGPRDDGMALDGPGHLSTLALQYSATKGRGGLGSLYVFAAGNGGSCKDHCGADGYVNNLYSFAIASATQEGKVPYYSERCPAIIATTYSGTRNDKVKIVTTDIHNSCTLEHSGTSASAPLAAGMLALVMDANKRLTWRDIYHIVILGSEKAPLQQDVDWTQNGFGLWYTPQFGFGLMNAFKMVSLALKWKAVPRKYICSVPFDLSSSDNTLHSGTPFIRTVHTDACYGNIKYLEHVQLNVTLSYSIRGRVEIDLVSPFGTVSKLMEVRDNDRSSAGFNGWTFLSLQFWGESPVGVWTVVITDKMKNFERTGNVDEIRLILHGTRRIPHHYLKRKEINESHLNTVSGFDSYEI